MGRRSTLGLFLAGLLISIAAASVQHNPGYMDADYYYAGALRLVSGLGGSEPYLWNYLNAPASLPAPSFSYWMPLVSLVAAAGLAVAPGLGFWGARLGLVLLAACIPPLTAGISFRLTRKASLARLAGLLALFPGFYLAYLTTTDGFAVTMVLGGLFFWCALGGEEGGPARRPWEVRLLALGVLAGLLHLTRADGLLWLVGAGWVALSAWIHGRKTTQPRPALPGWRLATFGLATLAGYLLVMLPWFARNLGAWGSPFPPGGWRALWVTEYAQLMVFPARFLTPQHWLAAGWGLHWQAWQNALLTNAQTAAAVQGQVVLLPWMLLGLWHLRRCPTIRLGALMWALIAGVMTLVFPFAGVHGGFFHSGAGLQPLLWAVAPLGVERAMQAYARWRKFADPAKIYRFMVALLLSAAALASIFLFITRVVGSSSGDPAWNGGQAHYRQVEQALAGYGAPAQAPVLVNNPPGYWLVSGRPALVIPNGDEQMLLAAARQYGARYLALEITNPWQLAELYRAESARPGFRLLGSVGTTRLYQIVDPD